MLLDVFKQDAFSMVALSEAIAKTPYIPGRAGTVVPWSEGGVLSTSIMVEEKEGTIDLVNPSPRGAPGSTLAQPKRTMRLIAIPHYQINDAVYADEILAVRAFGEESALQTIADLVSQKMGYASETKLDPTIEYQRLGALKGLILNGDGSTLLDLFDAFGVTQETEIDFDLDAASPASGALRKKCTSAVRLVAKNMGGSPFAGVGAFCGDNFWDDLTAHSEFRASYLAQIEASELRKGLAFETVSFGGIVWENYRGAVGGTPLVDTDKCHIFPIGTPGLFRTVNAPADFLGTVAQLGQRRYARQYERADGKAIELEMQVNSLSYCNRPAALIKGRRT